MTPTPRRQTLKEPPKKPPKINEEKVEVGDQPAFSARLASRIAKLIDIEHVVV